MAYLRLKEKPPGESGGFEVEIVALSYRPRRTGKLGGLKSGSSDDKNDESRTYKERYSSKDSSNSSRSD